MAPYALKVVGRYCANSAQTLQVMVYSLMHTQQVRILEACFNGENLVVSSTKLYDMMTEDTESLKLFL